MIKFLFGLLVLLACFAGMAWFLLQAIVKYLTNDRFDK